MESDGLRGIERRPHKPIGSHRALAEVVGLDKQMLAFRNKNAPLYASKLVSPSGEGWEVLGVTIDPRARGQVITVGVASSLTEDGLASKELQMIMHPNEFADLIYPDNPNGLIRTEASDRFPIGSMLKEKEGFLAKADPASQYIRLHPDVLASGGYNRVADFIRKLRSEGYFIAELERVLRESD